METKKYEIELFGETFYCGVEYEIEEDLVSFMEITSVKLSTEGVLADCTFLVDTELSDYFMDALTDCILLEERLDKDL